MATVSRYEIPGGGTGTGMRGVNNTATSTGTSIDSATSSGTSVTGTTSSQTQNSSSDTVNMDPASRAALQKLIQQLLGGGTPEMRREQAARNGEINTVQSIREGFSKEAAFGDATGLMSQQMRRAMEQLIPGINRAAEDAGSSGGALRALLMQDAANKAAESSAALGAQQAVQYGGITANLSGVLEALTRENPAATEMLVNALNVAKGAIQNTTGTQTTQGSQTQVQNTTGTQNKTSTDQKQVVTEYVPPKFNSTPQLYFGPQETRTNTVGTTADTLQQLAGLKDAWGNYSF